MNKKNPSPRKAAEHVGQEITQIETLLREIMRMVRTQAAAGQLEPRAFYRVCRLLAKAERSLNPCREYLKKREGRPEMNAWRERNDSEL
ncbi:MAG: hypothetical protein OEM98_08620 [Gammaproteobacteria bacterium]|nr:hypothetical protein [Gammaproteobacteria bacterium]